jgi:hypothetical protein
LIITASIFWINEYICASDDADTDGPGMESKEECKEVSEEERQKRHARKGTRERERVESE